MSLWREDFVIKNKFSRPGDKLVAVRGIIEHWTGNPGATDENHADFFDGADGGGSRYASAHIFVDKDSATLIIPLDEVAYQANENACRIPKLKAKLGKYQGDANLTTLSIEMCVEKDGSIHPETINRTKLITAELCKRNGLGQNDIYRHYDITGKNCPAPWVANPSLFTQFKNDVATIIGQGVIQQPVVAAAVTSNIITGSRVAVKHTASTYATGQKIASFVKGSKYQVLQVKNGACLLSGIVSWVRIGDLDLVQNQAPAPQTQPVQAPASKTIYLPPNAKDGWRIYPLNKAPIKANALPTKLNPAKFGGLTYEILGVAEPHTYIIQTQQFGRVKVYGHPSTGATIR